MKNKKLALILFATFSLSPLQASGNGFNEFVKGLKSEIASDKKAVDDAHDKRKKSYRDDLSSSQKRLDELQKEFQSIQRLRNVYNRYNYNTTQYIKLVDAARDDISKLNFVYTPYISTEELNRMRSENPALADVVEKELNNQKINQQNENWKKNKKAVQDSIVKILDMVENDAKASLKLKNVDDTEKNKLEGIKKEAVKLRAEINKNFNKDKPITIEQIEKFKESLTDVVAAKESQSSAFKAMEDYNINKLEEEFNKEKEIHEILSNKLTESENKDVSEGYQNKLNLLSAKIAKFATDGKFEKLKAEFFLGNLKEVVKATNSDLDRVKEILASNDTFIESVKKTPLGVAMVKIAEEQANKLIEEKLKALQAQQPATIGIAAQINPCAQVNQCIDERQAYIGQQNLAVDSSPVSGESGAKKRIKAVVVVKQNDKF